MATAREGKTANITFRLTPAEKALLEEGALRAGVPDVTSFVLGPALERARELEQRESVTVLTGAARELFVELMEHPPAPSPKMKENLRSSRHTVVTVVK
jgi:uncharacterized protein (DUF1778 family)